MARFAKRVDVRQLQSPDGRAAGDRVFEQKYPALAEYLCLARHDDGKGRKTATLNIFCEDGLWKCFVNDRDNGRSAAFSDQSLYGLLDVVEASLKDDTASWRALPEWSKKKK